MRSSCTITRFTSPRYARPHGALDRVLETFDASDRSWHIARGGVATFARRDPIDALHAGVSRFLDDLMPSPLLGRGVVWSGAPRPALRREERDDALLVRADLPGLTDENIDVHLDGQSLTIRADRAEVAMDRGHSVLLGTRARFERRLALPDGIDTVRASAEMRDGVVTVTMPKVASRLRETGGAFKERMRSLWSRLRGRGATRQS